MKKKTIFYNNKISNKNFSLKSYKSLESKYNNLSKKIKNNIDESNNSFHFISDKFKMNFNLSDLKRYKKFKTVAIVGMGGSILGSKAIYNFLSKKIRKEFIFFDNIDIEKIEKLKKKNLTNILFIIISKSGNTTETISNLLSLNIIQKNSKNIILISEKNNSFLHTLSIKKNIFHISHKHYLGGRYSVLSETGCVPAYLMGLNISKIRKNLLIHFKPPNSNYLKDSVKKMSVMLKKKKFKTIVMVNYIPELNDFLYWNQQLIAESLGKNGKGFLPLVSTAPKDHHSLLQLFLDGPKDKIFYFFNLDKINDKKIDSKIFGKPGKYLNKKSLNQIKDSQKDSFIQVLRKKNIPVREFKLKNLDEETLGELFSYFMLEISMIGLMNNANPFDQPAVEQVKLLTKKKLL